MKRRYLVVLILLLLTACNDTIVQTQEETSNHSEESISLESSSAYEKPITQNQDNSGVLESASESGIMEEEYILPPLTEQQMEIAELCNKDIENYTTTDLKKLLETNRTDLVISNNFLLTGGEGRKRFKDGWRYPDDGWYRREGSTIGLFCIHLPNGISVQISPPASFTNDIIYAPTDITPDALLFNVNDDKQFLNHFTGEMTINQVYELMGSPYRVREFYSIEDTEELDYYIYYYHIDELSMEMSFSKYTEYTLSQITVYIDL